MEELHLGVVETHFAELIWAHAPIGSGELVKLCRKELHWQKSTTYTVLKKLCGRGLFTNEEGIVTPLISRDAYYGMQSEQFVAENFKGSLPAFIAAFTGCRKLSPAEAEEIRRMIDESVE